MGVFDFIKSAGKSLGFSKEDVPTADALKRELDSHGLGTDQVNVEVRGDKAIIRGDASSQEILEKVIVAVGNTQGISTVETDVKVPDAKEPVFHTVKKGESLWKIAEKHYGNGAKHTLIFEANRPMLSHPDKIYPGQVLRIPAQH
jgi:nucleoid-associated protein YgaU